MLKIYWFFVACALFLVFMGGWIMQNWFGTAMAFLGVAVIYLASRLETHNLED